MLWDHEKQLPCVTLPIYSRDVIGNRVCDNDSLIMLKLQLWSLVKTWLYCKPAFLDGPSKLWLFCMFQEEYVIAAHQIGVAKRSSQLGNERSPLQARIVLQQAAYLPVCPEVCAMLSFSLKHKNVWEHLQADVPYPLQKEVPTGKVKWASCSRLN